MVAGSGGGHPRNVLAAATGVAVFNGGVGGDTSTEIAARMLADSRFRHAPDAVLIWAGQNNHTATETIVADVAAMTAQIDQGRAVVLGVLRIEDVSEVNAQLAATYGDAFFDVKTAIQAVTGQTNYEDYRDDAVHLNETGNDWLGVWLADRLRTLGLV